jgi:hypothetical protein
VSTRVAGPIGAVGQGISRPLIVMREGLLFAALKSHRETDLVLRQD